jgi:Ca-activated chloride channel homolog
MRQKSWMSAFVGCALMVVAVAAWSRGDDDDEARELRAPVPVAPKAAFRHAAGAMGATPGGAKDIEYARQRIHAGEVPHESTFTAEGLLSQYDLPLPSSRRCSQILCLSAAAARSDLIAQPEVRYLAQLGFASNLDARSWRREALNLVAVVDKSGSMHGQPLDTVKRSLQQIASQMTPRDQLAIVLYGDRSHVHLPPTPLTQRALVLAAIARIESAGSTAMEEGLRVGFALAGQSKARFKGATRVMLFTDERPNVGATDKDSFMGLAREGSRRGIGMTTVGVGTHFGAELATAVSSVRGGNLVFFPDVNEMTRRFQRDFDTLVTELAHDMKLVVKPSPGYRLVGLYGLPGDLVKRTASGGLELTIETIFLSRDKGGIFFGFARAGSP